MLLKWRVLLAMAVVSAASQLTIWIMFGLKIPNRKSPEQHLWLPRPVRILMSSKNQRRPYTLTFEEPPSLPWVYNPSSTYSNTKDDFLYFNINEQRDPKISKLILFYNPPPWYRNQVCSRGVQLCPIKACQCSTDHDELPEADAVIMDGVYINSTQPPGRLANQVWIFFGLEPPMYYHNPFYKSKKWRHMFNWTMTYRLDSDIPIPYDILVRQPSLNKNYTEISLHKSKSAVWIVSHCTTPSKREDYVNELRQYYDVDIYGECGKNCTVWNCLEELQAGYRFYLSFENSFCVDYITEKLFKVYESKMDIIPIVLGGADYRSLLPNGTYINTANFSSPKQIAEYLKYLEKNVTAYAELLSKKHQYVRRRPPAHLHSAFCDICVKMNNLDKFHNYYNDNVKWLGENACFETKTKTR